MTAETLIDILSNNTAQPKTDFANLLNGSIRLLPPEENSRLQLALNDLVKDTSVNELDGDLFARETEASKINNQGPYYQTLFLLDHSDSKKLLVAIKSRLR
jgi:hypothetical protein